MGNLHPIPDEIDDMRRLPTRAGVVRVLRLGSLAMCNNRNSLRGWRAVVIAKGSGTCKGG